MVYGEGGRGLGLLAGRTLFADSVLPHPHLPLLPLPLPWWCGGGSCGCRCLARARHGGGEGGAEIAHVAVAVMDVTVLVPTAVYIAGADFAITATGTVTNMLLLL